jgi:hypothetical protein
MLRFDNIIRLTVQDLQFDSNAQGPFIRVRLQGGKTIMSLGKNKNERLITPNGTDSCLYNLTERYY